MPIYEAQADSLAAIPVTSFVALGFKERGDLQRLLLTRIEAVEPGLLILADEYSGWADSSRRIDLLCLDTDASLVVIELKRDEDGGHMELQALRYAAMVSAMTFDQAVATLARYRNRVTPDEEGARAAILNHLGWSEPDEAAFARKTRIILVAADFGKEITTTVMWLRDTHGMDIRCTRLRPHRLDGGRVLLDIQPLIPLPEAAEFQIQIGAKQAATRKEQTEREATLTRFLSQLAERAATKTQLHVGRVPDAPLGTLSGSIGRAPFSINYVVAKNRSRVELLIQGENGRALLLRLKEAQAAIESDFGSALEWQEKEGVRQCRACCSVEGGYGSPESTWPDIQDHLINAMIQLDRAMRQRVRTVAEG